MHFKNVTDPLLLETQLDGLWLSTFKLHVNLARYQNNSMQRQPQKFPARQVKPRTTKKVLNNKGPARKNVAMHLVHKVQLNDAL